MKDWQAAYSWACSQPPETPMDGEWWWNACLTNVVAKAFKGTKGIVSKHDIKAPAPQDAWLCDVLTELYSVLYDDHTLTCGRFRAVLEKCKPMISEQEK